MARPNVYVPIVGGPAGPPGFASRRAAVGQALRTERIGVSVWEVPAGEAMCAYHFHYGEEEVLVVLAGRPSLRTREGVEDLAEGDVVAFPAGEEGAHQILNRTDAPVSILAVSTKGRPDIVAYPDSGKLGVAKRRPDGGGLRRFFREADAVDHWQDEPRPR